MKQGRAKEKERFIREGKMNSDGPMNIKDRVIMRGECLDMCSEYEKLRRILEQDVSVYECVSSALHLMP